MWCSGGTWGTTGVMCWWDELSITPAGHTLYHIPRPGSGILLKAIFPVSGFTFREHQLDASCLPLVTDNWMVLYDAGTDSL